METDIKSVKYQAEKVIRKLSEIEPKILYPYFDRLFRFIKGNNSILKLGTIITIANLLSVDNCNKWMGINREYLAILSTNKIQEFGNMVTSIPKILLAHPEEESKIIPILLSINSHIFYFNDEVSQECVNVAKGQIIDCFTKIYNRSHYQKEMMRFVKRNRKCERKQVVKKAEKFIKLYG